MSIGSPGAPELLGLDFKLIATALAVFVGTLITTIWGWYSAKKKVTESFTSDGKMPTTVTGAILMDNMTIHESTTVNREVRDQLLVLNHTLNRMCRAIEDNTESLDELLKKI